MCVCAYVCVYGHGRVLSCVVAIAPAALALILRVGELLIARNALVTEPRWVCQCVYACVCACGAESDPRAHEVRGQRGERDDWSLGLGSFLRGL